MSLFCRHAWKVVDVRPWYTHDLPSVYVGTKITILCVKCLTTRTKSIRSALGDDTLELIAKHNGWKLTFE